MASGSLPPGLTLEPDGVISGVPAQPSRRSTFTVAVTDSAGREATGSFRLRILKRLQMVSVTLPAGRQAKRYSARLKGAHGKAPYEWFVEEGSLPAGLSLNPATGVVSGTPSAPGIYRFTILLLDDLGMTIRRSFSLSVR
jgi:hypothetical protein